jgi:methyl-accepting chemotaxis protein
MNNVNDLKLGSRLGLGFAIVLALLVLMIVVANVRFERVGVASADIIEQAWVKAEAAATIDAQARANARRALELFFLSDDAQIEQVHRDIDGHDRAIGAALQTLDQHVESPAGKAIIAQIKQARGAFSGAYTSAGGLLDEGRRNDALKVLKGDALPAIDALQNHAAALVALQKQHIEASGVAIRGDIASARRLLLVIGLIALALGAALAWTLTRSIVRPIGRAVQLAQTVAAGDLSTHIEVRGRDETAQLLAALQQMNESLVGIVGQVRQSADSIATGSTQIASGNADLSQRTEEQASNLQQTAASMEELTSTVRHNAETARQASELATRASEAATLGGGVVGRVVGTMQGISESSHRIATHLGVIDDIAFQTNILALNAAVEAARAGEQGRGFAVVAAEVRNLAQRSAQAAKEIAALIAASVEQVEAGSRLADDAGRSMQDIVAQVQRVGELIAAISMASTEQSRGISQVGDAVAQLDRVTQQNAALVEESAAAADSLKQQAASLAQVVGIFKLGSEAAGAVQERVERRGPNRATNVTRPKFGQRGASAAAGAGHAAALIATLDAAPNALRNGTDGWVRH